MNPSVVSTRYARTPASPRRPLPGAGAGRPQQAPAACSAGPSSIAPRWRLQRPAVPTASPCVGLLFFGGPSGTNGSKKEVGWVIWGVSCSWPIWRRACTPAATSIGRGYSDEGLCGQIRIEMSKLMRAGRSNRSGTAADERARGRGPPASHRMCRASCQVVDRKFSSMGPPFGVNGRRGDSKVG